MPPSAGTGDGSGWGAAVSASGFHDSLSNATGKSVHRSARNRRPSTTHRGTRANPTTMTRSNQTPGALDTNRGSENHTTSYA